jgi:hypothetical protein
MPFDDFVSKCSQETRPSLAPQVTQIGKLNSTLDRHALQEAVHCDEYESVLAAVTDIQL